MTTSVIHWLAPCEVCGQDCFWAQTPVATTTTCPCSSVPPVSAAGHLASNEGNSGGTEPS